MLFHSVSLASAEPRLTRKERRLAERNTVKIGDSVQKRNGTQWKTFYKITPDTVAEPAVSLAKRNPELYRIVRISGNPMFVNVALVIVGKDSGRRITI